jgi:hypothetical protein
MTMCDDQRVPKPATGKTPVRNARIPDEVWLPALAKAEMEGRSASEAMTEALRNYAYEDDLSSYQFTFANWPDAREWALPRAAALGMIVAELAAAFVVRPAEWVAIAAWLASTHHPGDVAQQRRVITGHVLRRSDYASVREHYRDTRHLSETVQAILDRHLPVAED